jgi:hypothetical protein
MSKEREYRNVWSAKGKYRISQKQAEVRRLNGIHENSEKEKSMK